MENKNAKDFLKSLKKLLRDEEKAVKNVYHSKKQWTDFVKDITERMIGKTSSGKKVVSREYYRIDSLKYTYTDYYNNFSNVQRRKYFDNNKYLNVYNWKNVYAIEYENSSTSWTDELVKLSHIRSDLKVIIAYSEWK